MPVGDPLRPPLKRRELPTQARVARERWRAEEERYTPLVQQRIDGHLAAYHSALDDLERWHQAIADQTDIDLTRDTQWVAIWQVSGRCLGYARSLLILARAGHGDEALPLARALHECDRLLEALTDRGEQELVRRWLEDHDKRYVHAHEARAAVERIEQRVNQEMRDAGHDPLPTTVAHPRAVPPDVGRGAQSPGGHAVGRFGAFAHDVAWQAQQRVRSCRGGTNARRRRRGGRHIGW